MMRKCSKEANCLHPSGPILPESEYYAHRGGLSPHCKACHKAQTKKYNRHPHDEMVNHGETLVVEKLKTLGIYSITGKSSEFRWADVVAWGCVRIEVKTANLSSNNNFLFNMGYKKRTVGQECELVVLIVFDPDPSYHIFPSSHPIFYHDDGAPKRGVAYMRDERRVYKRRSLLDDVLMEEHRDKWHMVEDCRQSAIHEMQNKSTD